MDRIELLKPVRRVVVKIGTAALSSESAGLAETRVAALADQVHALRQRGMQVAVVSSGAIGAGVDALRLKDRPGRLPEQQACAAIGQGRLAAVYERCFQQRGYHAAQMLLTRDDLDDRRRYLNVSNALHAILDYGAVPLINENDTTSVEELALSFTDNDILAAMVTNLLSADLLVLLTVVDGLYQNPNADAPHKQVLSLVAKVTDEVRQLATASRSLGGRGGMVSKLEAAGMATSSGAITVIANARKSRVLERILDGEKVGTLFLPARVRMTSRKRWLRYSSRCKGTVSVDDGARRALAERGKSLLPSGIVKVAGRFLRGDLVSICDESGEEFARGLVNYSADDMARILGHKTASIRRILGEAPYDEAIHRDHLVLNEGN